MYTHHQRILYADTDTAGIVYHANFLRFFEAARAELLRAGGLAYAEIEKRGFVWPIVETWLRHPAPARYDDLLAIDVWVSDLRAASVAFSYAARDAATGRLLCEGTTRLACIRREGGVVPIPDDVRAVLRRHADDRAPVRKRRI